MFLKKTLIDGNKLESIQSTLGYEGSFVVANEGHSGGLVMLLRDKQIAKVMGSSRNHIDMEIDMEGMRKWRLTMVILNIPGAGRHGIC